MHELVNKHVILTELTSWKHTSETIASHEIARLEGNDRIRAAPLLVWVNCVLGSQYVTPGASPR